MGKRKTIRGVDPTEKNYGSKGKLSKRDVIQEIPIKDVNQFFKKKFKEFDDSPYILFHKFVKEEVDKAGTVDYDSLDIYRIKISPKTGTDLNRLMLRWLTKFSYLKHSSNRSFATQYGMAHLNWGPSITWADGPKDNVVYITKERRKLR